MTESSPDEFVSRRKDFICGVVEGFYGKPWTTEQRKDLFQKLMKWGMDMYVYAPKDDYKHRAYWRELYTVEEAEHLTSLITAAKAQNITFCYALSPGLDITYSNQKEITALKRKLEQVSQFGCTCFALLFDDIEPEMSEADKQIFQSFAHAQVTITNEIHQHLGCPRFLLCPTQYCSTRAVPSVNNSEYLNTLGTKLSQEIDIMWTGPKVISKILTTECIEEITQVLRRPPVIWDNLHANDYDQKRIYLGPYCGRSPELIPLLKGVLTNPNCEYNANMIAICTLAHWASCSLDAPHGLEAVSWDIKLEKESEQGICEDETPLTLSKHVYHHRQALRHAINKWLPEFSIPKNSQGPVIKPQAPVNIPPIPILPILPSVNTCMSLVTPTSNTSTTSTAEMSLAIPTVNTSQLQALTDVCTTSADRPILSTGVTSMDNFNLIPTPIMNSLVSPTKVILNESIPNPIIPMASSNISIPSQIPVSTLPVPILGLKVFDQITEPKNEVDQNMSEKPSVNGANDSVVNDSVLESDSFIEDMKKEERTDITEDPENIVVDYLDTFKSEELAQQNGNMSVGDTPQTMSPSQPSVPEVVMEPLDVDPMPMVPEITTEGPDTESVTHDSDIMMTDGCSENGSMQVEPSNSPLSTDMLVEPVETIEATDEHVEEVLTSEVNVLTADDLLLLCDLFYLPFEHGSRGLRLMHDFNWLATHAAGMLPRGKGQGRPEVCEWRRRRCRFAWWCARARRLARRLAAAPNQELESELHPYVWELCAVLALLEGFVRWLELGKFPPNVATYTQGSYTWFSKGWKEAFESGAQEPWVFRGGLTADLRRLLPVECGGEAVRCPTAPADPPLTIRPYCDTDAEYVCMVCQKTCRNGADCTELFPSDLQSLAADRLIAPFLTLSPEFCMIIEDDMELDYDKYANNQERTDMGSQDKLDSLVCDDKRSSIKPEIVGYACAVLNSKDFYKKQEIAWIPEMCKKYPVSLLERTDLSQTAKDCIQHFHKFNLSDQTPECVTRAHSALLTSAVLPTCKDPYASGRLVSCILAALRANGVNGVHVCLNTKDHFSLQYYTKLGFIEITQDAIKGLTYLGRAI